MKKIFIPMLILVLVASSCGLASSKINELCLVYSGGISEDATFEKLLTPGSNNNSIGVGSNTYCYRIDQRSYIAGTREGNDTAPVEVVSDDDVRLSVEYQLYFTINQDEEIIRQFHENLGVKTEAWKDDGWAELLRDYFEPHVARALEQAALQFEWRDLYGSEEARNEFSRATVTAFRRNMNEIVGGDYFCGPSYTGEDGSDCGDITFTVGRPDPVNPAIVESVEREQTLQADTVAQQQENERIRAELEIERELVELYGPEGALLRDAIKSGQIQFMVIPGSQDVSIPIPAPAQE